jgi:hypothetical protein
MEGRQLYWKEGSEFTGNEAAPAGYCYYLAGFLINGRTKNSNVGAAATTKSRREGKK